MSNDRRFYIDGLECQWVIRHSRSSIILIWYRRRPDGIVISDAVELGRLDKWRKGRGWLVTPRLGGRGRSGEQGARFALSRDQGAQALIRLARAEQALSVADKVRFGIIRDGENDILVDVSATMVPVVPVTCREKRS